MMALELPHLKTIRSLIGRAGMRWDGDLVLLQEGLLKIRQIWNEIVPSQNHPLPYYLTANEERAHSQDVIEWSKAFLALAEVRRIVGIDVDGGTTLSNYEDARRLNAEQRVKSMMNVSSPPERDFLWRIWPYKDKSDRSCLFDGGESFWEVLKGGL